MEAHTLSQVIRWKAMPKYVITKVARKFSTRLKMSGYLLLKVEKNERGFLRSLKI